MKFENGLRGLKLFYCVLLLMIGSAFVFGQADKPKLSADEAAAAKKLQAAKTFTERLSAADELLKKFPQTSLRKQIVDFLVGQVFVSKDDNQIVKDAQSFTAVITDPAESDAIVPGLIDSLVRLKRLDEAFAAADKYLPRHEGDVAVRLKLAIEGSNQLRSNNNKYATQTKDYASQAIQVIEANTKPADVTDETWKEYQTKWLPELYSSLGFAYFSLNDAFTAKVCFEKAVSLDPNNVIGWYMLGNVVNETYQDLAKKYTVATGTEKSDTLAKATEALDKVIDVFAHVVAITDGNATYQALNTQVRQDLEAYYKYRNNNSTTGLQELINKYKPAKP